MNESGIRGRANGLLVAPPVSDQLDTPTGAQHQALQVLTLAQRTAEEHLAGARGKADNICAEARAQAEQIVREAQAHARGLHEEAEKALADAHAQAEQIAQEADAQAKKAQRTAEDILSDARARAHDLARKAQANADDLMHQAKQRYDDVVGSLATKREGLQEQIEALEQFDREYRAKLTTFMQSQLRALWVNQPQLNAEVIEVREAERREIEAGSEPEGEAVDPTEHEEADEAAART